LIAALDIAIGAAWGALLSNFAAGAFIPVLRPFKVGDYVLAGEVEGTVRSIGLFNTTIDSPDNVLVVRPYVHNDHYWQVYFDTNRVIRDTFGTTGYPVPEAHVQLRQLKAA